MNSQPNIMTMKLLCLFFSMLPAILFGNSCTTVFRMGYFYPSSEMREVNKKGGVEYEIENTAPLCGNLSFWLNYNTFNKHNRSSRLPDKTTIQIKPLSLGVKYTVPITACIYPYLGIGASCNWVKFHDDSSIIKKHTHKKVWGGVAKFGFLYFLTELFFLDFFADYYYTKMTVFTSSELRRRSVNIG